MGKPPPLAVRLAKALPFRRPYGMDEATSLCFHLQRKRDDPVRIVREGRPIPHETAGSALWHKGTRNGRRGLGGPSGPFPASLAPSGGLHQTTRSAGST